MQADAAVQLGYISGHLVTALLSATVGYWIVFRTKMRARHLYGVYALSNVVWSLVSAAAVAAPAGPALSGLWAVWFAVPIVSVLCLVAFASAFTELLALSRAGKDIAEPETVSLKTVVRNSWDAVQPDGTDLDLRVPETATVDADRDRLLNVFENLFRNAREHNEPPLMIRVGLLDSASATGANESVAGFYITDDGDGIPDGEREAIFDHGYTTNRNGTGFGLSIVKEIVEAHDWVISIRDSEDGGARFEVVDVEFGD